MLTNPNHRFVIYVIAVVVLAIAFIIGLVTDPTGDLAQKGFNLFLLLVNAMAANNVDRSNA